MYIKRIFPVLALVLLIAGCTAPSPLYGTWTDNKGNQITFIADNTYTAKIVDSVGISTMYNGDYNVLVNALSFVTETTTVVTEWDIRGNMLYLTWVTAESDEINLTLYKTA